MENSKETLCKAKNPSTNKKISQEKKIKDKRKSEKRKIGERRDKNSKKPRNGTINKAPLLKYANYHALNVA